MKRVRKFSKDSKGKVFVLFSKQYFSSWLKQNFMYIFYVANIKLVTVAFKFSRCGSNMGWNSAGGTKKL